MAKKKQDKRGNLRVRCKICGDYFHHLGRHLKTKHGLSTEEYLKQYPGVEIMSPYAKEKEAAAEPDELFFGKSALPVLKGLSEIDQEMIPIHDDDYSFWNSEIFEAAALSIELNLNLLLVGPTGCGKTSLVLELAALTRHPAKRVNLDGDVRSSDFLGQGSITVDEESGQAVTGWVDGIVPQCMRNGWWLILDELDAAPAHVLMTIQSVLENGHTLTLKENGAEIVKAHPNFRIIATANTLGRGDESGLYAGTNVLNEATLDRFGIVANCTYPPKDEEIQILTSKTSVDEQMAKKLVEAATLVRNGWQASECDCTFSTRRLINWALLAKRFGKPWVAAKYSVLDRLGDDDRKYVAGIMQRVVGGTF